MTVSVLIMGWDVFFCFSSKAPDDCIILSYSFGFYCDKQHPVCERFVSFLRERESLGI